jgi:hypothetical protein
VSHKPGALERPTTAARGPALRPRQVAVQRTRFDRLRRARWTIRQRMRVGGALCDSLYTPSTPKGPGGPRATGVDVVGDAERRERAQALATLTRPGPRTGPSLQCPPFARARPPRNAGPPQNGPFLQMPAVRPGAPAPQRGAAAKRTLPSTTAVRRALRPARTRPAAPRRPGRNRPGRHRPSPPSNYAEQGESALLSPRPITSLRPTVTPSGRSHVSVHASTRPGVISSGPAGSHFASTVHGPAAR